MSNSSENLKNGENVKILKYGKKTKKFGNMDSEKSRDAEIQLKSQKIMKKSNQSQKELKVLNPVQIRIPVRIHI